MRGVLWPEQRALAAQREADRKVSEEGAQQELAQLRERMAVIKQEAAAEVDRKWGSPFRTQEVFDLKVRARLSGNQEYRSLQGRLREIEARLAAQSGTAAEADPAR